jgi:glycosyltransferase involved in cell wall biosynthesis
VSRVLVVGINLKILLVGMADSIHLSRWLSQFDNSELIFEVVSSSPHRRVQAGIRSRIDNSRKVSMGFVSQYLSLPMWVADRILSDWVRGMYIAWRIRTFKPDIVHVHELQNAGYATRRAFQVIKRKKPKLIVTNYGSEIVWFSKFSGHRKKLKALLEIADAFSAECTRDYDLASKIATGFESLPLMPVAGGLSIRRGPELSRTKIAIKGYDNHWGKALLVLEAVSKMSKTLENFEIVLYSCNKTVIRAAKKVAKNSNIRITTFKKGALSHEQVLRIFETSLVYIGHSLSDGISTSMLEAMAMGAIPIQTDTSCADEWIIDKRTGFLIKPYEIDVLSSALMSIVKSEFDSDYARKENYGIVEARYNPQKLGQIASKYYERFR